MVDGYEFLGYRIVAAPCMRDLVQARRHKKKRINKKWRKRYGMRAVPWKKFLIADGVIYGHPKWIDKLKEVIIKKERQELQTSIDWRIEK